MNTVKLKVKVRDEAGKGVARRLRREGMLPCVLYGKGEDTLPLTVDQKEFEDIVRGKPWENIVFDLTLSKGKKRTGNTTILREAQQDPITRQILHLDFYRIRMDEPIETVVPFELLGQAEGVKLGGILERSLWELEIKCLPTEIPDHIRVDVSDLNIGDVIHVRDLTGTAGLEVLTDGDMTVLSIVPPAVEPVEEEEIVEEEVEEEPEVIGEKEREEREDGQQEKEA